MFAAAEAAALLRVGDWFSAEVLDCIDWLRGLTDADSTGDGAL
jgi:hypothetical protein